MRQVRGLLWRASWPARWGLIGLIRLYRLTFSGVLGGQCRFHPSCSLYAEGAIRNAGALRGTALAAWRLLRCSPLSRGGIDYPPEARPYDGAIRQAYRATPRSRTEAAA